VSTMRARSSLVSTCSGWWWPTAVMRDPGTG
jgi:hypothetical protein